MPWIMQCLPAILPGRAWWWRPARAQASCTRLSSCWAAGSTSACLCQLCATRSPPCRDRPHSAAAGRRLHHSRAHLHQRSVQCPCSASSKGSHMQSWALSSLLSHRQEAAHPQHKPSSCDSDARTARLLLPARCLGSRNKAPGRAHPWWGSYQRTASRLQPIQPAGSSKLSRHLPASPVRRLPDMVPVKWHRHQPASAAGIRQRWPC